MFNRSLLPTSTPRISKIEPPLWCQLGSILPPKITAKIDPKMHQFFNRFLHRLFLHSSSNLEPKLGPCWPLFRLNRGEAVRGRPLFCCDAFLNRFFWKYWSQEAMGYPVFGPQVRWGTPFLVDFWTQFGANSAPSWATLVQELVLYGLVGLREASRIQYFRSLDL